MSKELEKENEELIKNLKFLLSSGGFFYLVIGICLTLVSFLVNMFIPLEYIGTLGISPFILYTAYIFAVYLVILGIFHLIERFLLKKEKKFARIFGLVLSIAQIWFFPIGTFVGYILFGGIRNYYKS